MEEDPYLEARIDGELVVFSRFNSCVYTFFGELAVYNHIFVEIADLGDNAIEAYYIFKDNPMYQKIGKFMLENRFPMFLNQVEVPVVDLEAWNSHFIIDLEESEIVPEDWIE